MKIDNLRFNSVDLVKMVMAALVVAIHVGVMLSHTYGEGVWFVLSLAVPFFFVASGFLIENRMMALECGDAFLGGGRIHYEKCKEKLIFVCPLHVIVVTCGFTLVHY